MEDYMAQRNFPDAVKRREEGATPDFIELINKIKNSLNNVNDNERRLLEEQLEKAQALLALSKMNMGGKRTRRRKHKKSTKRRKHKKSIKRYRR